MRDAELISRAKPMRATPSEPEYRMWLALRAKRFGNVKFRRQKVIGRSIVDFAARDPMLVIEIDGDTHAGAEAYDAGRTAFLKTEGYRVVRFSNAEVLENMEGVLTVLDTICRTALLPPCAAACVSPGSAPKRLHSIEAETA